MGNGRMADNNAHTVVQLILIVINFEWIPSQSQSDLQTIHSAQMEFLIYSDQAKLIRDTILTFGITLNNS